MGAVKLEAIGESLYNTKKKAIRYHELMEVCNEEGLVNVSDKKLAKVRDCYNVLVMKATEDFEKHKVEKSYRCKDRMCPVCTVIDARLDALKLIVSLKYFKQELKKEAIFTTFTIPNCKGKNLRDTITLLNESFRTMTQYAAIKRMNIATIKKIEVTYNAKTDTYNPHLHVIFIVERSYFKDTKKYISRNEFGTMWTRAVQLNSIKIFGHEQECKGGDNFMVATKRVKNSEAAAKEMGKYISKPTMKYDSDGEITEKAKEVYSILYEATRGKQLSNGSKEMVKVWDMYKEGELSYLIALEEVEYVHKYLCFANMQKGCMDLVKVNFEQEFTNEELAFYNNSPEERARFEGKSIEVEELTEEEKKQLEEDRKRLEENTKRRRIE